jgi:hypothetical protein
MTTQIPADITSDEVRAITKESRLLFLGIHNCSMCNYPCGYVIDGDVVSYDAGCDCTGRFEMRPSNFGAIADIHNMQKGEFEGVHWRTKIRDALAGKPSLHITCHVATP